MAATSITQARQLWQSAVFWPAGGRNTQVVGYNAEDSNGCLEEVVRGWQSLFGPGGRKTHCATITAEDGNDRYSERQRTRSSRSSKTSSFTAPCVAEECKLKLHIQRALCYGVQ